MEPGVPACPWPNLPTDLLLDVSGRLHDAGDFVSFQAVCQPWRDAALSPAALAHRHKFLPWLTSHRNGRIVHSPVVYFGGASLVATSRNRRRSYCGNAHEDSPSNDRSWVTGTDGEAIWLFASGPRPELHDLITGAVRPLAPFPDDNDVVERRMRKPHGIVYGDGSIFLYSFVSEPVPGQVLEMCFFTAAILRSGDTAWTLVEKTGWLPIHNNCAVYHNGKIFAWVGTYFWFVVTPCFAANGRDDVGALLRLETMPQTPNNGKRDRNYVLESRGVLLWVSVFLNHDLFHEHATNSPETALSVTMHALEEQSDGGGSAKMRWVEQDGSNFGDRVLFLGLPTSFAANAVPMNLDGGCAYFVFSRRLFRCNLSDGKIKLIEDPCFEWDLKDKCLWLRPQPTIAPIAEIQGRVQTRNNRKKEILQSWNFT